MGDAGDLFNVLEHLEDEAFQIARLGHARQDRMIAALSALLDQSDFTLGITCRQTYGIPKLRFRNMMRTGTRHQKTFRLREPDSKQIDVLIPRERLRNRLLAPGERRGIKHDHIVAFPGLDQ